MKRYEVVVNDEVFEVSLRELQADETIEVTPQTSAVKTRDKSVGWSIWRAGFNRITALFLSYP